MAVDVNMEGAGEDLVREIPPVPLPPEGTGADQLYQDKGRSGTESGTVAAGPRTLANRDGQLEDSLTKSDLVGYISDYVSEDDDAAVYLQQLGLNFAVSARSTKSRGSTKMNSQGQTPSISLTQSVDLLSDAGEDLGITCRQQSTRTLVEISNLVNRKGGDGQLYRLLSAKRNHINQISNDVVYLQRKNKELEEKNRLLVRLGKRQEAALKKYHNMKSELPHIIESHRMEISILQDKIRKMTETSRRDGDKIKSSDTRLLKLTEEISRLRDLSKKRHLPERNILSEKLSKINQQLLEKENIIQDLKHRLQVLEKSVKQQVMAEIAKQRIVAKKLQQLQQEHSQLKMTLLEREKELGALQHYRGRLLTQGSRITKISPTSSISTSSSAGKSAGRRSKGMLRRGSSTVLKTDSASELEITTLNLNEDFILTNNEAKCEPSKLPPISDDIRRRQKEQDNGDHPRRTKYRISNKDTEEWRAARRRQWRGGSSSPHLSSDESTISRGNLPSASPSPRACTPLTSPPSPMINTFNSPGESSDNILATHSKPIHAMAETITIVSEISKEHFDTKVESASSAVSSFHSSPIKDTSGNVNIPSGNNSDDVFSLIGHYPPRERRRLETDKESSGTSDSGSSGSPQPSCDVDGARCSLRRLSSIEVLKYPKSSINSDTALRSCSSLSQNENTAVTGNFDSDHVT